MRFRTSAADAVAGGSSAWRRKCLALLAATGLAGGVPAFGGQGQDPSAAQTDPPRTTAGFRVGAGRQAGAVRVEAAPLLDGNVLDDPAWDAAPPATGFRQTAPDEGQPASERTEVRVVFTDDTIYFGVVCYDRDPGAIIVTDSRRDSSLADSDSFQLILDTFLDRQNGFVFGTSPSGQGVRRAARERGRGRQRHGARGHVVRGRRRVQPELGRRVAGADRDLRPGVERRVRHSVPHPPLPRRSGPDLGGELPAQHPAPERARLLGAVAAAVSTCSGCRWPASWPGSRRRRGCGARCRSRPTSWARRSSPPVRAPARRRCWATSAATSSTA